jgi:hypothetical protein
MINLDANLHNADWTKKTWDRLDIDSEEKLLQYLKRRKMSIEDFKKLPIYKFNRNKMEWLNDL